jgi:site-specific recombinase XerD
MATSQVGAGRPRIQEQGLPSRVYLKSGTFYYVHKSGQRWERLGRDLLDAKKKADVYNNASFVMEDTGSMRYFLGEWQKELNLKVKSGDLAARTCKDYTDAIIKLSAFFGDMLPENILPKHVGEYLDLGRELNRAVRANREKAAFSSCFTWLIRIGVAKENPCKGVKRNKETKRDRLITDEEYLKVYDISSVPVRTWMTLIYRTLQRPADILKWTHSLISVDASGSRSLSFRQGKTDRVMTIILNDDIELAITELCKNRVKNSKYLIHTEEGERYTEMGLSSMFRRHVVTSGVGDFALYDIKAKGATDMYREGTSLETICELCGHESVKTTEIYIKAHARNAVNANSRVINRR